MSVPIRELANAYIEIDGAVMSNQGNKVGIKREAEMQDATGFRAKMKQKVRGIPDAAIDMTLFLNFGEGSVNSVLAAIFNEEKEVQVAIKPKKGPASATNPKYVMKKCVLAGYPIELAGPKQVMSVSVTFENVGEEGIEEVLTPAGGEAE